MKKDLTYIIFLVDRSGSMESIANDIIGGYNSYIRKQRESKIGECKIFFYQFDTHYETIYDGVDINFITDLSNEKYLPRGSTALYCSLGKTITDIGTKLSSLPEEERPSKVLFVTITDGLNNDILFNETIYTLEDVKNMIQHQIDVYNWDFVYIGANQDAWGVGETMGIGGNTKLTYAADAEGTAVMFDKLCKSTISYRSCATKKFSFDEESSSD